MYAPQSHTVSVPVAVPGPVVVRLIGILDAALVDEFAELERDLILSGGTALVDVRDLHVLGETEMRGIAAVVAAARASGRDVRLDARSLPWKRVAKAGLSAQPAVDAQLRAAVRRTVILAHSAKHKSR